MVMSLSGTMGATFPDGTIQSFGFRAFISSNLAVPTANSQNFTVSHGLGVVPKLVRVVGVCTIAAAGYSVGDEVDIYVSGVDNGNLQECAWYANASIVGYSSGNGILVYNRSTHWSYSLTNATGWAIKVYAFA